MHFILLPPPPSSSFPLYLPPPPSSSLLLPLLSLFQLLPASQQEEFRGILQQYFVSVRKHLLHEHKELHKRERKNRQILQSKGELSEERRAENEAAQKAYDKLLTNSSTLAVRLVVVHISSLVPRPYWDHSWNETMILFCSLSCSLSFSLPPYLFSSISLLPPFLPFFLPPYLSSSISLLPPFLPFFLPSFSLLPSSLSSLPCTPFLRTFLTWTCLICLRTRRLKKTPRFPLNYSSLWA